MPTVLSVPSLSSSRLRLWLPVVAWCVVIFAFSLCVNEFIYAFTLISSSEQRTVSAGIPNDLIRGDVFFWQSLMAAVLIPTIPLALLYNAFLDRFIKGFTGGAFR